MFVCLFACSVGVGVGVGAGVVVAAADYDYYCMVELTCVSSLFSMAGVPLVSITVHLLGMFVRWTSICETFDNDAQCLFHCSLPLESFF